MNLSEVFLDGSDGHRSNAALAYSYNSNNGGGGMPKLPAASTLGEVSMMNGQQQQQEKRSDGTTALGPPHAMISSAKLFPYNRSKPLPIPTLKKPSPPRQQRQQQQQQHQPNKNMTSSDALATAAAIATQTSQQKNAAAAHVVVQRGMTLMSQQTAAALSVQPTKVIGTPTKQQPGVVAGSVPAAARATPIVLQPQNGLISHIVPRAIPVAAAAAAAGAGKPASIAIPKPGMPAVATAVRPPVPPGIPPPKPGSGIVVHQYPPGHPYTAQAQARARQLAAHAKTKGSIAHATAQRSKFGFGGDHKVPSVPAPPPVVKGYGKVAAAAAISYSYKPTIPALATAAGATPATGVTYVPSTTGLPKDVGTVIAYEKKKQRAKDARVKLNEALEGLAVAIDLAGSQSKERFNYITKTTGTNPAHMTNGQLPKKEGGLPQHPLARLMDQTIQQSSTAKKWDRPSFVGLASSVIHSLNAQCEGLMREVAHLRIMARRDMNVDAVPSMGAGTVSASMALSSTPGNGNDNGMAHVPQQLQQHGVKRSLTDISGPVAKKQQLDLGSTPNQTMLPMTPQAQAQASAMAIHNTVQTPNLLKHIASFLDPKALCKCLCVSKQWSAQNIFQNNELWLNVCIRRFGVSAVRKWQDREDDEGQKDDSKTDANNANNTNLNLFREMSEKNVKPYSPKEGNLLLGGSSLDGLVSCWVSLVDRSNGETSRSVMQQKVQTNGEANQYFGPIPVVELRLLVQNTGYSEGYVVIPDQQFSVDASTRRTGEKMLEVCGDDRFKRQVLHIERKPSIDGKPTNPQQQLLSHEMCHLRLYETAVIAIHLHARGCSTTAKFCNRSKKIQLLVSINGTTRPISIPVVCANDNQLMKKG